ncbi:RNA polymerase sigma factor [Granulicella arctica]|uniref:RNA polymerase sigma factor n=1 Tax=Granulicella arctica TaxID=940613 RepID=UPI0021DF9F6B|nr:sigma-70 family RNA polymerase sigma factor [Granulicella arctica]
MSAGVGVWVPYGEDEEALLCHRTSERDEAFAGMVARQSRFMFRVAYSLLRNAHDAEDAVQEAFLKLYRGEAWQAMEDEKPFLARTVWRAAIDRLPRKGMEDIAGMNLISTAPTPEGRTIELNEQELLRRLIHGLPEELRQVLVLSAVDEMTSREVAIVLGVPEGTVRTRQMRAKMELKKRFESMKGGRR